jgi:4-amino-4-deoxy-L-arabinose transferase-like glycosyltransferase
VSVVDDVRLLQLAAKRPKDIFPTLERAASLSPLVFVLTVFPAVVALQSTTLSERDAQWQLKGLELASLPSIFDAVDPATTTSVRSLKYQPPLVTWMTAAADRWAPFDSTSLPLFEYLAAASLVPACFLFMSRLAGRRIGLLAAALTAFHGAFLHQYRHVEPHSLAVTAALITCWGFLGHIWLATEVVSIDLLIGGISLGVCLLAGGPLAIAVVVVLLLVSLIRIEPSVDLPQGLGRSAATMPAPRSRRPWSSWHAVRSLGVMTATAFAAGGWWELMMLYSYGGNFGSAWLFASADSSGDLHMEARAHLAQFAHAWCHEVAVAGGLLSGLSVLGLWLVGRNIFFRKSQSAARQCISVGPLRFVAIWMAVSGAIVAGSLYDSGSLSLYANMWRLFFSAACVCMAAVALDAVSRRKVSLLEFVCLTLATLGCGYAFLNADSVLPGSSMRGVFVALALALLAGRGAQELCRRGEGRDWMLITLLLTGFVLADAGLGIFTLEAADPDYQSLTAFSRSLAPDHVDAEVCLLVCDGQPPARLQLALKSVWPKTQIAPVRDWDEALKVAVGEGGTPKTAVVVDWTRGNSRPANPTGARWDAPPIGNPQFFEHRPLRAYVLVWE